MSTLSQVPGRKVGMTQVFDDARNAIPVTVISCGAWYVTQIKTAERDGYDALQVAQLRKRYKAQGLAAEMLKKKSRHFEMIREVRCDDINGYEVGQMVSIGDMSLEKGTVIKVTGTGTGRGFQGVVKRWNFAGGPGGHGSNFHRKPGAIGNMCSQGKVLKGKKLPGHMGAHTVTTKGLEIVQIDAEQGIVLVKGAVPGRKNSWVYLAKQG